MDAVLGAGGTPARRSARRPTPSADVFINDFGPLAASVFEGAEPAALGPIGPVCRTFPATLGRRGFGVSRSVTPGFFRIAKSAFSMSASSFGELGEHTWAQTTRSVQADTSETKGSHRTLLVSKWRHGRSGTRREEGRRANTANGSSAGSQKD
jgi:hypothetical protein